MAFWFALVLTGIAAFFLIRFYVQMWGEVKGIARRMVGGATNYYDVKEEIAKQRKLHSICVCGMPTKMPLQYHAEGCKKP